MVWVKPTKVPPPTVNPSCTGYVPSYVTGSSGNDIILVESVVPQIWWLFLTYGLGSRPLVLITTTLNHRKTVIAYSLNHTHSFEQFRYMKLYESISITSTSTSKSPAYDLTYLHVSHSVINIKLCSIDQWFELQVCESARSWMHRESICPLSAHCFGFIT